MLSTQCRHPKTPRFNERRERQTAEGCEGRDSLLSSPSSNHFRILHVAVIRVLPTMYRVSSGQITCFTRGLTSSRMNSCVVLTSIEMLVGARCENGSGESTTSRLTPQNRVPSKSSFRAWTDSSCGEILVQTTGSRCATRPTALCAC